MVEAWACCCWAWMAEASSLWLSSPSPLVSSLAKAWATDWPSAELALTPSALSTCERLRPSPPGLIAEIRLEAAWLASDELDWAEISVASMPVAKGLVLGVGEEAVDEEEDAGKVLDEADSPKVELWAVVAELEAAEFADWEELVPDPIRFASSRWNQFGTDKLLTFMTNSVRLASRLVLGEQRRGGGP